MAAFPTGAGPEDLFTCQISGIPSQTEFRSPRTTPKPVVQGPQTAKVVGTKGEEIYCDKYGRIKIHFYWDREGKEDETASCWVRVSQDYAGKNGAASPSPASARKSSSNSLKATPIAPLSPAAFTTA